MVLFFVFHSKVFLFILAEQTVFILIKFFFLFSKYNITEVKINCPFPFSETIRRISPRRYSIFERLNLHNPVFPFRSPDHQMGFIFHRIPCIKEWFLAQQ